MAVLHLGK